MPKSKYQAEWKSYDKNEAFWDEVLVGRMIRGAAYNPGEMSAQFTIKLDTEEVVYLPGDPEWGVLDLIAPAPAGPVGQRIQRIVWDDIGIAELVLQVGSIKLDKTFKGKGRLWIVDSDGGHDRAGTVSGPTPGVDPIAEAVDKQIVEEMVGFVASQDVMYTGELAAAQRRAGVESDPELEKKYRDPWLDSDDEFKAMYASTPPDPRPEDLTSTLKVTGVNQDGKEVEIERTVTGQPGTLDELRDTVGYIRPCGKCGHSMKIQTWSASDGGHEDNKYTCPACGNVEWVDGIDS